MNRTIRLVVMLSTVVLLAACAVEERPQQSSAAAAVTQTTTTAEPPAREVKPSPEVLALLKPDPDLDVKMTEEQVRTALAAAANTDVLEKPLPAPNVTGAAGDEWRRLEDKQSERNRDYRRRLESTTVYMGPDRAYHASGCPLLTINEEVILSNGVRTIRSRFIGTATTLAGVQAQRVSPHNACSPPAVQYTY
jgi:hypothetical protein